MRVDKSSRRDVQVVFEHDPVVRNTWEVIFVYSVFHARQFYCLTLFGKDSEV